MAEILRNTYQQSNSNVVVLNNGVIIHSHSDTITVNGKVINGSNVLSTQINPDAIDIGGTTENSDAIAINAVISSHDHHEPECIVPTVTTPHSLFGKTQNVSITTKFTKPDCKESIAYSIRIPAKLLAQVTTKTTNGNVAIKDINGSLDHDACNGNIKGHNIAGDVEVKTVSGDQKFTDIGGTFRGKTTSGNIFAESIDKDCLAKTTSGDVSLQNCNKSVSARSTSGNIHLDNIARNSDAKTVSGNVDLALRGIAAKIIAKSLSGTIRNRAQQSADPDAPVHKLSTVSGNITINP